MCATSLVWLCCIAEFVCLCCTTGFMCAAIVACWICLCWLLSFCLFCLGGLLLQVMDLWSFQEWRVENLSLPLSSSSFFPFVLILVTC
jgi:hypothetical protein